MKRWAVLLTGLQNDYLHPGGALAQSGGDITALEAVSANVAVLQSAARRSGVPMLHLRELTLPGGRSDSAAWLEASERAQRSMRIATAAEWGSAFVDGLGPQEGEAEVERFRPSGLQNTRAEVLLRSQRVNSILIAGVETHCSILATAVQAVCLDYDVVIPTDCVASVRQELHDSGLAILRTWCDVRPLAEVLPRLEGGLGAKV